MYVSGKRRMAVVYSTPAPMEARPNPKPVGSTWQKKPGFPVQTPSSPSCWATQLTSMNSLHNFEKHPSGKTLEQSSRRKRMPTSLELAKRYAIPHTFRRAVDWVSQLGKDKLDTFTLYGNTGELEGCFEQQWELPHVVRGLEKTGSLGRRVE